MMDRGRLAVAAAVNAIAIAVLGVFVYISVVNDIDFGIFSGDAGRVPVDRWYAGLLSDIGIVIWFLAVPTAIIAAIRQRRRPRAAAFYVAMAAISAWLALDDLLLLHEEVVPDATGIPEQASFAIYGIVVAAVIALSMPTIRRNLGWVLALSLVLLGMSLVISKLGFGVITSTEAGSICKFLGIVNWTLFFAHAAMTGSSSASRALQRA